mmetsp:Transcript_16764/g.54815  ORF Transcript_16764/g.54815 Transcript_16764/m.54815 type:complete len:264 (+) Transcript_16764:1894-2685(+)
MIEAFRRHGQRFSDCRSELKKFFDGERRTVSFCLMMNFRDRTLPNPKATQILSPARDDCLFEGNREISSARQSIVFAGRGGHVIVLAELLPELRVLLEEPRVLRHHPFRLAHDGGVLRLARLALRLKRTQALLQTIHLRRQLLGFSRKRHLSARRLLQSPLKVCVVLRHLFQELQVRLLRPHRLFEPSHASVHRTQPRHGKEQNHIKKRHQRRARRLVQAHELVRCDERLRARFERQSAKPQRVDGALRADTRQHERPKPSYI